MEKKIAELSLTETQSVAGGIKVSAQANASLSVHANNIDVSATMGFRQPVHSTLPARYEALLAKR